MTRESQKLYELNVVKLFRDAGGLSHYAELHVPDHLERPDIIARIDSITIGIEIRNLFNDEKEGSGSRDCKRRGIYESVVKTCSDIHSKRSDKWIDVQVSFSSYRDADLIARRKTKIAEMLVKLVEKYDPKIGDSFTLRAEKLWGPDWPEEIDYVRVIRLEGDHPPHWSYTDSFWVGETTDELIQNALDDKERNILKWRDGFDEAWVLLVLDGSVGASTLRPHEQLVNNEYLSSFDRACVMEFDGKSYRELRLRRAKV